MSLGMRIFLRMLPLPLVVWLLILLPAGTYDFWQVYLYFGSVGSIAILGIVYFLRSNPAVLERRLQSKERESTQKWVMAIMGLSVVAIYLIPGFDKRFGWSQVPVWLVLLADLLVVAAYLFMLYVFKVNAFAARTIQVEENQPVIDSGPYAHVRHPMYTGAMLMYLCTPLALGSWWGLLPVVAIPPVLVLRIKANSYNNNIQIVQTRDHVMIKSELGNDPRIIPLDGRPFLDARIRYWTGSSRGHWEGDTLVVETRHFPHRLASLFLRTESYGSAEHMVLSERFTRVGEQALDYEFTIDDPATFTDRLTVKTNMSLLAAPMYEFACHEGNYALVNMLRAARLADREARD